jgi:membrane associated rhomboid family serine protease
MSGRSRRTIAKDVKWGVQEGVVRTGLMLVPASFVVLLSPHITILGHDATALQFAEIAALYLLFGAVAGLLAGLVRPILSQLWGANLTGATIGAIGVVLLVFSPRERRHHIDVGLVYFSAGVGACMGAAAGAISYGRNKQRSST